MEIISNLIKMRKLLYNVSLIAIMYFLSACSGNEEKGFIQTELFTLTKDHAHGSTIVELPNGDLLAAWFQGSGERWADDVQIMGARLSQGSDSWGQAFIMADVPDFPDINPVLFLDKEDQLWLVWYTVIANQWSTSLPTYRISKNYMQKTGAPEWEWQQVLFVKPGDKTERGMHPDDKFVKSVESQVDAYGKYIKDSMGENEQLQKQWEWWKSDLMSKARGENMMRKGHYINESGERIDGELGYPYFRRMGWQTKNKAVFIDENRMILPLYSDGFNFSLMAITDDGGLHWQFSEPLVGPGNIQASIAIKEDGSLLAYMRDNGPPPKRLMISESKDRGMNWSMVKDSQLPNEGSGADIVTMKNGHWVLAYNDTEDGRNSLAVSISTDEGKTWSYTRHLESDERDLKIATQSSYPSIIEGKDGIIHVIYSFHRRDMEGKANETIKYARITEEWIIDGD
ncbi:MAG: neuraminidase (sialidase)-like protein [Bacteroidetes bacterium]|nr:MAG: neuraminidase (sialidase)-like protein [Bacteroidota bacterium]